MWNYEKRLQFPVNIKETNPEIAKIIITQYGTLMVSLVHPCGIWRSVIRCPTMLLRVF